MKNKPIYVISAHALDDLGYASRTFGYYHDMLDALWAVHLDFGGMQECLYTHLVIEEVEEGIFPQTTGELWFRWDCENNGWAECEKPESERNIVNFGIG